MKSFVACIFLFALVSGGLCARKRREAPAEAAGGPPADPPAPIDTDGLQIAIDALEAKPNPDIVKINTLKFIHDFLEAEKAKSADFAVAPAEAADFAAPPEA